MRFMCILYFVLFPNLSV